MKTNTQVRPPVRHLRGQALRKYRDQLLALMAEAEEEMKHASMRLGWGRKWHKTAQRDLLKAGRKRGLARQQHWLTIGKSSLTIKPDSGLL